MVKKHKILIIANDLTGLYKFRHELIEILSKKYDLHIFVPFKKENNLLNKETIKYHNMKIDRRGKNPFVEISLFREYKKKIKKIRPDIILTYTIKPNIYGGLLSKRFKIPYITTITGLGSAINNSGILQKIILFLYKRALKKSDIVFFQNHNNKKIFSKNNIITNNFKVIPGSGVNIEEFKPTNYPQNEKIILTYLGRLMKDKGTLDLINAIKKINSNDIVFNFVGTFEEDNLKQEIEKLSEELNVSHRPYVENVIPIIAESDAIINPSHHEGMSNILLEAAASARPILASNIPGCRETFDNGITGISFEPKNTDSLVEAINKFISLSFEERKQMGLNGRKKIEKEFNRDIVIEAYINKIEELLREKN